MVMERWDGWFLAYRLLSRQSSGSGRGERCIYLRNGPGIVAQVQHLQQAFQLLLRTAS
jgi:hypothetical protein